jgi:replicative DNA helicase
VDESTLDLTVLRLLRDRGRHERLFSAVSEQAVDAKTYAILKDYKRWFREHDGVKTIEHADFMRWFKMVHPKMKADELAVFTHVLKKAAEPADPKLEDGLLKRLAASAKAATLAAGLAAYADGEEIDFRELLSSTLDDYDRVSGTHIKPDQVLTPIDQILDVEENDIGFDWPLAELNACVKPMRPGDFAGLAASVDAGKTTATAHIATHWARQVDKLFPGEERSGLWLCNEGPGDNIVLRCWQSACNWTIDDMAAARKKGGAEALRDEYRKALGGRAGALRIFEVHGRNSSYIEGLFRKFKPAFVVFDMIDNVEFSGKTNDGGERTDQILEAKYQWARLLGVKYNCAMLATSQLSVDGFGLQYPQQHMLKDSKVGKQGAMDLLLMLGKGGDPSLAGFRYLSAPKNKRRRQGTGISSLMAEVIFDGDRARLRSPH